MSETDAIERYLKESFAAICRVDDLSPSPGCGVWWKAYGVHADEMRARLAALRSQKTKPLTLEVIA